MYLDFITKNNITYSIDMLRLTTKISYNEFSELEFRLNTVYSDYIKSNIKVVVLLIFNTTIILK